ncbi:MAG: aspartate transaminase [Gallionella sp.]|nr:aspartate transaminase [Gallionella sp.]
MGNIHIASRLSRVKPSPSSAAQDRAAALRRAGKDIVNLVVGEPDFDTPEQICRAACEAIQRGETRYTQAAGTLALRQAIADKFQRENGLVYSPKEIIVTVGAKHAIYNALSVTLEPGDEVIIPAPYWVSYPDMTLACQGEPVIVTCQESDGFKLTPAKLDAAITAKTRWLILNSPTNPTGSTYSATELRALANVLLRHPHVMLMTDDIYEHIRFESSDNPHLVAIEPQLQSRTLVINGVSKTYAMTGWRIGWAAGPAELISALDMLQSQSVSNASSISQAAALAALQGDQTFIAEWVKIYKHRRDLALKILNAIPGISCRTPGGAFYLYVNCSGMIGRTTPEGKRLETDVDVVMYLLEGVGVALIPGTVYGLSPYFRMSIAASAEVIEDGCRRIERAVTDLA